VTDIHNTAKRLERLIEHIRHPNDADYCNCESIANSKWVRNKKPIEKFKWDGKCVWDISSENQIHIIKFCNYLIAEHKSPARTIKYIYTLRTLNGLLGKPFDQATKDDIVAVVADIERKQEDEWTKRDYKQCLKFFYRWLREMEKEDGYPPEVRWIHAKNPRTKLVKEDLLTREEVLKMVEKANDIRSKCYVAGLAESGMRPEEYQSLLVSSVVFTDWGCILRVPSAGKTGARDVPVTESAEYFLDWINVHPLAKANSNAPLWVSLRNENNGGKTKRLSYSTASGMVKSLAKLAGISKRVTLGIFRHSGATRDSKIYKTPILRKKYGWSPSSRIPDTTYLHLDADDVVQATLEAHGIESPENNGEEIKKGSTILKCPRCQEINSISAKYCKKCWFTFNAKDNWLTNKDFLEKKVKEVLTSQTFILDRETIQGITRAQFFRIFEVLAEDPDIGESCARVLNKMSMKSRQKKIATSRLNSELKRESDKKIIPNINYLDKNVNVIAPKQVIKQIVRQRNK